MSDAAILDRLHRHLTLAATQQSVAASNIANLSTPGYRAQEVSFDDVLDRELSGGTNAAAGTNPSHVAMSGESGMILKDREGLAARRDGNNVQVDRELLAMTDATAEFSRAQTVLAAKFRLVRYAIKEGR